MRRFRRFLPSPAMVVAVTALVMSLGGSAYALVITGKSIKNGSVTTKDIHNRSLTGNDMRGNRIGGNAVKESTLGTVPAAYLTLGGARFAVVNAGGQAVRGRNVSSVARTSAGRYQVIFNSDVRGCAYFATLGDASASVPPQNGQISVELAGLQRERRCRAHGERHERQRAGPPFHLIVMC